MEGYGENVVLIAIGRGPPIYVSRAAAAPTLPAWFWVRAFSDQADAG